MRPVQLRLSYRLIKPEAAAQPSHPGLAEFKVYHSSVGRLLT